MGSETLWRAYKLAPQSNPNRNLYSKILTISNLSILYESKNRINLLAVDSVDLEIGNNEFVAVVGESGCGKSTLALGIIGLLACPPARIKNGSIEYKSVNLLALKERDRRKYRGTEIAMIFQEPLSSLNPVYKVGDQIAEAIAIREERKKDNLDVGSCQIMQKTYNTRAPVIGRRIHLARSLLTSFKKEVLDALRRVRIPDPEQVVERYPFELSGGMAQRVMIAMALAQKPALLIADEPTTALDVTTQAQVLKLMKILMDEVDTSILFITHDLAVASQVADRIIVMYAGEVVEDADVYELFSETLHPYSKGLLACIPSGSKNTNRLIPIQGVVPVFYQETVGCKYASRCPYVMPKCRINKPVLTEVKPGHKVACFLYVN
jgi:peptide/nickel transport system ATP-binding protein